jgi:hypothetical protein
MFVAVAEVKKINSVTSLKKDADANRSSSKKTKSLPRKRKRKNDDSDSDVSDDDPSWNKRSQTEAKSTNLQRPKIGKVPLPERNSPEESTQTETHSVSSNKSLS